MQPGVLKQTEQTLSIDVLNNQLMSVNYFFRCKSQISAISDVFGKSSRAGTHRMLYHPRSSGVDRHLASEEKECVAVKLVIEEGGWWLKKDLWIKRSFGSVVGEGGQ